MNADNFVEQVKKAKPNKESLLSLGVSDEYIAKVDQAYSINQRYTTAKYTQPLMDLVDRFEVSFLEIGMIGFNSKLEESSIGSIVGTVESDLLVVDDVLGEVKVVEYNTNHTLWSCAQNEANFLDAIAVAAAFLEKATFDDDLYENQEAIRAVSEHCSMLAGGEKYQSFYQMLLGLE